MYPDPTRTVFGHKALSYLEHDMSCYLSRVGVMPILIPDLPQEDLLAFLAEMDGFVFQGGADIAPQSYQETPIENGRWPGDQHRDQYELKIMDYAFKNHKPVLAICRGFQLMNVFFGGKLYQDLAIQTKTPITHRDAALYDRIHHSVTTSKDSLLFKLYGKTELEVNTVHHQGVSVLGKDLVVDAVCPDDQLIEAFHYKKMDEHYFFGVQWHPEFSHTIQDKIIDPQPIYDHFITRVAALRRLT